MMDLKNHTERLYSSLKRDFKVINTFIQKATSRTISTVECAQSV